MTAELCLIDTDILSYILKQKEPAYQRSRKYLGQHKRFTISCLTGRKGDRQKNGKKTTLEYFQKAIENGFNNLSLIREDEDLDFIRNEKEFREMIDKLRPE